MFASLPRLCDVTGKSTSLRLRYVFLRNFVTHAHQLFDELPHRDLSSLNSQLSSYIRSGNLNGTLDLFLDMHRASSDLSSHTFTPVLSACALLPYPQTGRQVHALMIKQGTETGTISKTSLINMYSKHGALIDSVNVFKELKDKEKDVVSWNALLSSFLKNRKGKEALTVFASMCKAKIEISEFTLCSVLKICASLKILQQGKQVHAMVVVTGRDLVVLGTAIIGFYSSVGLMNEAMKVCVDGKDEVMSNSLISGCVRNRNYKEAYRIMSNKEKRVNVRLLISSLAGCSDNADLWIGKQIHCVALRTGLNSDSKLCNGLIDMYGKSGEVLKSRNVFNAMSGNNNKTVVSWTSLIDAYGVNGDGIKAVEIFKEMCVEVSPNLVTFLVVLSACAHAGLVKEGKECFELMKVKYKLVPETEHYVCFIDVLSKAGEIDEIWRLVENDDKRKVDFAIWVAVLSACSLNMDVKRGEFAVKKVMEEMNCENENENASVYVLVSNFYAAIGKWDLVEELRLRLKMKGLVKEAGHSLFI